MTRDVTAPQPPPAASNEAAVALLDAANSASQHVAVLHGAFMALCAYVLVIVFGTTDMDLLIGKGVKLPVVDVTVPIVGFYAFAPYLVFLVHFNLKAQLRGADLRGSPKGARLFEFEGYRGGDLVGDLQGADLTRASSRARIWFCPAPGRRLGIC